MKLDDAVISERRYSSIDWQKRDFNLTMRYEDMKTGICSTILGSAISVWTFTGQNAKYFSQYHDRLDAIGMIAATLAVAVSFGAYRNYLKRTSIIKELNEKIDGIGSMDHFS